MYIKIKVCFTKVGEGPDWPGTSYESWGEMPQVENHQHISSQHSNIQTMLVCREHPDYSKERARLLGLSQRALNEGNTNAVVFVTGDQVLASEFL